MVAIVPGLEPLDQFPEFGLGKAPSSCCAALTSALVTHTVAAMQVLPLILSMALGGVSQVPDLPVEQYQLSNGLTVLLSEDHSLPVVSLEVMYLVGSGHERVHRTGFAHLFEHLMFQGSEHYNQEYFTPYTPIGGRVNGTTSRDRTNFFETVPSNYLETPLWMESDRMQHLMPALTQEKLDNQREVVKNERRQRYENAPYGMAHVYLGEAMYPKGHPYRHTAIGSHEDLTAATLDDVRAFFENYYVPANAVLALVGDFSMRLAKAQIEQYFGKIPAGTRAATPTAVQPVSKAAYLQKEDDVPLPRIYLAWHSPALYADGDAELDLLSTMLVGGKSSRLYKPLVYEQKVAKSIQAYQYSQRLSSTYVIEATAAPGQSVEALYSALVKALTEALKAPPTEQELARAKSGYKKGFYGRVEGVQSRASTLASYYLMRGNANSLSFDLARYTSATTQGVSKTAVEVLQLDQALRLDIVPRKKSAPAVQVAVKEAK